MADARNRDLHAATSAGRAADVDTVGEALAWGAGAAGGTEGCATPATGTSCAPACASVSPAIIRAKIGNEDIHEAMDGKLPAHVTPACHTAATNPNGIRAKGVPGVGIEPT